MSEVTCPECGSTDILDITAFENRVDWAQCRTCGHDFSYDMPTADPEAS